MVKRDCFDMGTSNQDFLNGNSEINLLMFIISKVLPEPECRLTARALLHQFGDIRGILHASCSQIMQKTGASRKVAEELNRTCQLMQALVRTDIQERPLLDECKAVVRYCRAFLAGERREQFHSLFLDKSFHLLAHECLQIGTVDHVAVYPRELIALALQHSACSIILIHNHPSGSSIPSSADLCMTKTLQTISEYFGISILDHIIVGKTGDYSFREHNLMNEDPQSQKI